MKQNEDIQDLISLRGKKAIITGGANGIGYAISYRLAEAGATVCIADLNLDEANKACAELGDLGYKAIAEKADVSSEQDVKRLIHNTVNSIGGVDILVNNAGIFPRVEMFSMAVDDFDRVLSTNLKSIFLCSREVSRYLIDNQRQGCIINLASVNAVRPSLKGFMAYDASKGGVLTLTKSLALELGKHNIRVNAIAPGGIMTGTAIQEDGNANWKTELKTFLSHVVLGRMGKADDIARVALFLASDLSSYITGTVVFVDGGFLIS